jgi:hypothetical protein
MVGFEKRRKSLAAPMVSWALAAKTAKALLFSALKGLLERETLAPFRMAGQQYD